MNRKAPAIVFDDLGTVGFVEPGVGEAGPVTILLDDGRKATVPADFLVDSPDGRRRLVVGRERLEEAVAVEAPAAAETVIPLVAEEVEVGKRTVQSGRVRVKKGVATREETVSVPLVREVVEVERVPINRPVDGPIEPRREGDVWVVSILEEVLVVEKRLMLKEELRITRRRVEETATESVTLRTETATVERAGPDDESTDR